MREKTYLTAAKPLPTACAIAFPAGTGIAHNVINNGGTDMRMMVIGQRNVRGNRLYYPRHVHVSARWGDDWWTDAPQRPLGPRPKAT